MLAYTIRAGLLFGFYFTLIGIGLNLVFGVMRIVNLAHGDFLMLGAFLAFWLFTLSGLNPVAALPVAFALFVILGLPLYYLPVPRLIAAKDPEMRSFILFFGFSQVIEAVVTIAFGTSERSIPGGELGRAVAAFASLVLGHAVDSGPVEILGQTFPATWVASGIVSAFAVLFVYFYLYRTRIGYLTRAVMVNREEAVATGIDVHLVMDEPSSGRSPLFVKEALLIAEQNVKFLDLADRVYTVEGGRIGDAGSVAAMQENDALRKAYFGLK